ncbi:unnamed protein product, partial [Rotaria sordida]
YFLANHSNKYNHHVNEQSDRASSSHCNANLIKNHLNKRISPSKTTNRT